MSRKIYCAMIMGQGGALTSEGVPTMADSARKLGVETDVYVYEDYEKIGATIDARRAAGCLIAGLGYSLGCSTLTWLQTKRKFDLVLCVAASSFGQNYRIDKQNTVRAILWRGPTMLSSAGGDLGFDAIHDVMAGHLLMDVDPTVTQGVQRELHRLIDRA